MAKRRAADKDPMEIRFLLNRKGLTFADVDRMYGLPKSVARVTARCPNPKGELAIAECLGMSPREIWPSRYDPSTGERLKPQPGSHYTDRPKFRQQHQQKVA
ncbi:helix-turn-helix domain-containing protein [Thalassobaculum sp. OXR-137]|uniref:helix-turn-helix domain-containing protein n=1 Tax=Thalassobaculum sp. OXR-137 TaxID=3100173 RepID=UPI002AC89ECF|nr:helix-turn-helix domain-containing protein [Thalassobaculum sp. OXR-137]WPZ33189.1 helix-turn-helix domain-containing protein [Thalassobaculum sp. OXR-137]